jgi:RimJ/RimL family protein N-acetyltransferase
MGDKDALTTDDTYVIRPMRTDDLPVVTSWFSDFEDIALFDRNLPVPICGDTVIESWKSMLDAGDPPRALWYIVETAGGDPVGLGGLQAINYIHGDATLPMFVARRARTNGLATAIATVLLDLAFNQLRLHRVSTCFRDDHATSERVTRKVGFREEGRVRQGWFRDGAYCDVIQVGILESEWRAVRDGLRQDLADRSGITIRLGEIAA